MMVKKMNNEEELDFRKDFFIEIFLSEDKYSRRKLYNLYIFIKEDILIYDIKSTVITLEKDYFEFKITSISGLEKVYKLDVLDKNDKKIYKFLQKFLEKSNTDYNIIISNVQNVIKYQDMDFLITELFRIKFKQTKEEYKYEN